MTRDEGAQTAEWVPPTCTLPTAERPFRVAEFDRLFASALVSVAGGGEPGRLRLVLDDGPGVLQAASDLAARESECCSFFTFGVGRAGDRVVMDVSVDSLHAEVLSALERRARAVLAHRGAA